MNVEIRRLHRGDDALVMRLANLPPEDPKGGDTRQARGVRCPANLSFVMYGRPLLGKRQNSGDGISLERSCIRPLIAVDLMTAGPQGLRGSGSNHSSALWKRDDDGGVSRPRS